MSVDYGAGDFAGDMTVHVTNTSSDPHSELFFRLFANDPSIYGSAQVYVSDVRIQTESLPITLFVDDTVLMVPLPVPLSPGESVDISMTFAGRASVWPRNNAYGSADTGYGILTKSTSALTLTAFYPILAVYSETGWALDPSTGFGDTLMSDAADYHVRVTVSDVPTLACTGQVLQVTAEADALTYECYAEHARDFSLVLFEDLVAIESVANGCTLRSWFSPQHEPAATQADVVALASLLAYESMIGPSPFQEIDFVEVPLRNAAGVEFSGLILVGSQYAARPEDQFFSVIIAHELAHQWFYAAVGNDVSEHPWLDEAFATYLSYEVIADVFGAEAAQAQFDQSAAAYLAARQRFSHLSIASPRYAFPDSQTYSSFVYSGGATFLNELRSLLGDEAFYRGVKTYFHAWTWKIATPRDLIAAFEESCLCRFEALLLTYRIVR